MTMSATPPLDQLKKMIRDTGLRSTAPRLAVLKHLLAHSSPISHGELVDVLAHDGMDRTTVYRNLVDLTEAGLVQRTDVGDHVWRFELKRSDDHTFGHPHFRCTDCGIVACLPDVSVKVKNSKAVPKALAAQKVEVQLRGLCDKCAA
jgi:Fur family transcriptional regulator, ferric uptake regulator